MGFCSFSVLRPILSEPEVDVEIVCTLLVQKCHRWAWTRMSGAVIRCLNVAGVRSPPGKHSAIPGVYRCIGGPGGGLERARGFLLHVVFPVPFLTCTYAYSCPDVQDARSSQNLHPIHHMPCCTAGRGSSLEAVRDGDGPVRYLEPSRG